MRDFFVNIMHTVSYIKVTFHDPLRGKLAAGEGKTGCWGKNIKTENLGKK